MPSHTLRLASAIAAGLLSVLAMPFLPGDLPGSLGLPITAAARPDYSGEWTLSTARSRIDQRIAATIESGRASIVQTQARLTFRRTFISGGKEDKVSWDLALDGTESETTNGPVTRRARLDWDGEVLVLRERLSAPQGEATNTVRYSLLDGGRTLEARESFRGPRLQYDNVWVFGRYFPRMQ